MELAGKDAMAVEEGNEAAGIDAKRRGETLSLAEFARLSDAFSAGNAKDDRRETHDL